MVIFRIVFFVFILICNSGFSQTIDSRIVKTAVPFLLIVNDARSSAMGEAGTSTAMDVNAVFWNPAALIRIADYNQVSVNYSPLLTYLNANAHLFSSAYAWKINNRNTLGASFQYFTTGKQSYTDDNNNLLTVFTPSEFAFSVSYAKKMGEEFSLGTSLRFIYSGLYGSISENQTISAGSALAGDVAFAYNHKEDENAVNVGLVISNIGARMSYFKNGSQEFLPTILRFGVSATRTLTDLVILTVAGEAKKLLVPTPPLLDNNGELLAGRSLERSVVSSIFGSFSDAPGGIKEELREINRCIGAELKIGSVLAARAGYSFEHLSKGGYSFVSTGFGTSFKNANFDVSYTFPQANKLTNTFRISVQYSFQRKNANIQGK